MYRMSLRLNLQNVVAYAYVLPHVDQAWIILKDNQSEKYLLQFLSLLLFVLREYMG